MRDPKIVCIGGGTGMSTLLSGLKLYTPNITAIVTVADDGGGSGVLRNELGMPPPGDIRNCILALANIEPTMSKLLNYRFEEGSLKGQSFGNLFLAAMNGISSSFKEAVAKTSDVLNITGRVYPVTSENVHLLAEFEDSSVVLGESKIVAAKKENGCKIKDIKLIPENPPALPEAIEAIRNADMIILGPGSLYTSILPNLLVKGIPEAIDNATAEKLYIANVMTQEGETEGFTVSDHINVLLHYGGIKGFDMCLSNTGLVSPQVLEKYALEGASQLFADREAIEAMSIKLYEAPLLLSGSSLARHNPRLTAREIFKLFF
ncbi:MAG: YvcK family protein [Ruminococcaceae bacterium]|nr:YvcK family protein [Oscillospiraceae bacterium]